MSKVLFELQDNIKNLRQELSDLIHLSYLNHKSYLCLKFGSDDPLKEIPSNLPSESFQNYDVKDLTKEDEKSSQLKERHNIIEHKLKNLSSMFQKRSQNHLNYLIIKQIQSEEECVRRDRLTEYEEKIYDQRRLISDKEVFTESLLRPKKQRPDNMTSEHFQELRAVEKTEEEKAKIVTLEEELKSLQLFRKRICQSDSKNPKGVPDSVIFKRQMELYRKVKNEDFQKTKAHSLETVNLSSINNNINSDKNEKPFEEEELSNDLPMTQNETKKNEYQQSVSEIETQKISEKINPLKCYPFELQKLIQNYEKSSNYQQVKEKQQKISELLRKIKEKKQLNSWKQKQLRQLEMENAHMRAHLRRTKELYIQNRQMLVKSVKRSSFQ